MSVKNKMTRRDFLRASALGLAGVLAASCAPAAAPTAAPKPTEPPATKPPATEPPAKAPVTVTMMEYWSTVVDGLDEAFDKWAKAFDENHPEADVVIDRRPFMGDENWEDVVVTAVNAGTYEDVGVTQPYFLPIFVDAVPLFPLDDALEELGGVELFSGGASWKGEYYHTNWDGGPFTAWYNKEWFDEVGVEFPETWEEHISIGKQITDAADNRYMTSLLLGGAGGGHIVWAFFIPWLLQAGGQFADPEGRLTVNTDEGVQVLEFWKRMEDEGILTPGSPSNSGNFGLQMFGTEREAWIGYEGPWMPINFDAGDVQFECAAAVSSEGPGGRTGLSFGTGYGVNANAEHVDYAVDWLIELIAGDANRDWCADFGTYQPIIEELTKDNPLLQPCLEQIKIGTVGMDPVLSYFEVVMIMAEHVGKFWVGDKTAKQALDDVVKDWEAAVARL